MNTTADLQSPDLQRIIAINENIKKVLNISASLHLIAINSMLVAKSAGERLLGFGVVSTELRIFSRNLDQAMANLARVILDLVKHSSRYQKMSRERELIAHTMSRSQQAARLLDAALDRKDEDIGGLIEAFELSWKQLGRELTRSIKLCAAGNALVGSAKIEAAYGGEKSKVLAQVSDQIDATVLQIQGTLNRLKTDIEYSI